MSGNEGIFSMRENRLRAISPKNRFIQERFNVCPMNRAACSSGRMLMLR